MEQNKKEFADFIHQDVRNFENEVPSGSDTCMFVDKVMDILFPFRRKMRWSSDELSLKLQELEPELTELMLPLKAKMKREPAEISEEFIGRLPALRESMVKDADAFLQFDPAAESIGEVILCYPGFFSIAVYRLAHELQNMKVPVLPRVMTEYAHGITGVDIHPGAQIGDSFFIDHATGTVIGETAVIGNNVKIYQGVTLGALFVRKSLANQKRHPTIEDNVIIYAGSTILGGDTVVGHDSVIGGNVWLTESVVPYSVVYMKHHVEVKDSKKISGQINWII